MVDLLKKQVKHSGVFGVGTVTGQNEKYIAVQFAGKVSKFAYPDTFEKVSCCYGSSRCRSTKEENRRS